MQSIQEANYLVPSLANYLSNGLISSAEAVRTPPARDINQCCSEAFNANHCALKAASAWMMHNPAVFASQLASITSIKEKKLTNNYTANLAILAELNNLGWECYNSICIYIHIKEGFPLR